MNNSFTYITNISDFDVVKKALDHTKLVAIDTEFERTQTFYPILHLFQIATAKQVFVIEPVAIEYNWLGNLLGSSGVKKVFHACNQDLEALYNFCKILPRNIFDTQVAAALTGFGEQVGYADLCQNLLQVSLSKECQWSDWSKRPLDREKIEYAANDVRYLLSLYHELHTKLLALNRKMLMKNIMKSFEEKEVYERCGDYYYVKHFGMEMGSLDHMRIVYYLLSWREDYCQRHNMARNLVISDQTLRQLTCDIPYNLFLPDNSLRDLIYPIYKRVCDMTDVPAILMHTHLNYAVNLMYQKIKKSLRLINIPAHYIATTKMIIDFLIQSDHRSNPIMQKWRKALLSGCMEKLFVIKRQFQAQQNQSKKCYENIS